jgi:hypothetical protein
MREAGKTPCGARQNRGRAAGPLILGYRRITRHASVAGARREPDEINDHRPGEIRGTEFGLSSSQTKGAFGTEGALPLSERNGQDLRDYLDWKRVAPALVR